MAIDSNVAFVNTNGSAFPNNEAVNASGPSATDGTEFVKTMIDNYMFGPQQALLDYAGLTPNGTPESAGASQELDALKFSFGHPGESVDWYGQADPGTLGLRLLLLNGQGVLVASYPELTNAVYVGDGNNATAEAFFRADDAGGAVRNINGDFLILADARGRFKRALDTTGAIDPDGASRLVGDSQEDTMQGHHHDHAPSGANSGGGAGIVSNYATANGQLKVFNPSSDGVNGVPRTGLETRAKNISIQAAIRY